MEIATVTRTLSRIAALVRRVRNVMVRAMGGWRLIPFIVLIGFAAASFSGVRAQGTNPPAKIQDRALTPQESERYLEDLNRASGMRIYEGLCTRARDFIAKKGAMSDPLLSQFNTLAGINVLNALVDFCATGRFVLSFYDRDGKCPVRTPLAPIYVQLIRRLPFVRSSDVEIIAVGCIETSEKFALWNPRAHSIVLTDSQVGGVEITGGTLTYNLEIFDSTVNGQTKIESMTIGSTIDIARSKLGPDKSKDTALFVRASSMGALWLQNTTINGSVAIESNQVKGKVQVGRYNPKPGGPQDVSVTGGVGITGNDIRGDLYITSSKIGTYLDLRGNSVDRGFYVCRHTTVGEWFDLFAIRSATLELCDLEVNGTANAVGMKISETVYIGQSSGGLDKEGVNFKKGLSVRNLKADRLRMMNADIGDELTLIAMNVSSVSILNSKVEKKIHAGDARINSLTFRNTSVPEFECSDCEISQYALLAGKFSGLVNLRGAQIRSSLIFRDGERDIDASSWQPGSRLDLRSIQVESIEADYCDLLIKSKPEDKACTGSFVPTLITGAKFRNIVPGRNPTVMGMAGGLLDQDVDKIVSWVKESRGNERFHPQPYDLVADSMDRAGRHRSAVDVRIAKLDDDYSTGDYSWFIKAVAKVASILTGYGYHNERSVWAFAVLIAVGMAVFLLGRHASPISFHALKIVGIINVLWYAFWFSIDRAVPPLHIDESMKEYSVLTPGARAYFYFHRGIGMVILSFFVAGITGLFK